MNFAPIERGFFASLADLLIPAGEDFPAASQAGVADEGLDQALAVRPDLIEPLKRVLAMAQPGAGRGPAEVLSDIQKSDPEAFAALTELVPGAYFLDPGVRAKLKYDGQIGRPIEEKVDYLDDGLLQSVIDRGPIYRPAP